MVLWQMGQMGLTFSQDDLSEYITRRSAIDKFMLDIHDRTQLEQTIAVLQKLVEMDKRQCKFKDGVFQEAFFVDGKLRMV